MNTVHVISQEVELRGLDAELRAVHAHSYVAKREWSGRANRGLTPLDVRLVETLHNLHAMVQGIEARKSFLSDERGRNNRW